MCAGAQSGEIYVVCRDGNLAATSDVHGDSTSQNDYNHVLCSKDFLKTRCNGGCARREEGMDLSYDGAVLAAAHGVVPNFAPAPGPAVMTTGPALLSEALLSEALRNLCISYLRLERMNLGDEGAIVLAHELAGGAADSQLKALYLGSNNIGDEGALALAEGLNHRPRCRLRKLGLQDNRIGPAGYKALRSACAARNIELIGLTRPPPMPKRPALPCHPRIPLPPAPAPALAPAPAAVDVLPCYRAARERRAHRSSASSIGDDHGGRSLVASRRASLVASSPLRLSADERHEQWDRLARPQPRYLHGPRTAALDAHGTSPPPELPSPSSPMTDRAWKPTQRGIRQPSGEVALLPCCRRSRGLADAVTPSQPPSPPPSPPPPRPPQERAEGATVTSVTTDYRRQATGTSGNTAAPAAPPAGTILGVDSILVYYSAGLAASFGISHIDFLHNNLTRFFPRTYPTLNVLLPCGRALGLLGIFARGAELAESRGAARRSNLDEE